MGNINEDEIIMKKIIEDETLEKKYEKLLRSSLRIIATSELEPVHSQIMSALLNMNLRRGYCKHITGDMHGLAKSLQMDKNKVLQDLHELCSMMWTWEDGSASLEWADYELEGNIITIVFDEKYVELFMRMIAKQTLRAVDKDGGDNLKQKLRQSV